MTTPTPAELDQAAAELLTLHCSGSSGPLGSLAWELREEMQRAAIADPMDYLGYGDLARIRPAAEDELDVDPEFWRRLGAAAVARVPDADVRAGLRLWLDAHENADPRRVAWLALDAVYEITHGATDGAANASKKE